MGGIPFVERVSLTGSFAEGKASEDSDIDFFVQVKRGRLYLTRFLVTLLIELMGVRRRTDAVAGRICLNWFAIFNGPAAQGRKHILLWRRLGSRRSRTEILLSGRLGDLVESITKNWQLRRFRADPRTHLPGSQVRFSDTELGFHPPKGA